MHRLYLKIYVTVIASLVLVVMVAGGVWRWGSGAPPGAQVFEVAGEIASSRAAALDRAAVPQQQRAIGHLAQRFRSDLGTRTTDGTLIAMAGRPLPPPPMNSDGEWLLRPERCRPGRSNCRTTAAWWSGRCRATAIRWWASCWCWAASRSRSRSAPIARARG